MMRIAVLHFSHETVTFLPNDTTLEDFIYPGSPVGGEALLQSEPKSYIGGFVQVAREFPMWSWSGSSCRCGRGPAPGRAG